MNAEKLTTIEKRAITGLSSIMALRMIGLFMVLPVFSLYAKQLSGATPFLVGIAMGVYGLFQALFQIPFGTLSDRIGRKPIILFGLCLFAFGSLIAASAHSILLMIIGRAFQGMGAIGSTTLAMMADLTREEQRTKSMAIAGITIGLAFSIAMVMGPLLTQWMAVNHLFYVATVFGLLGILILYTSVPTPISIRWHRDTEPELKSFIKLLTHPELGKLNIGIFILHAIFTASFMVIPLSLLHALNLTAAEQWKIYLPTLLMALFVSLFCIGLAERKQQLKPYFIGGILALLSAEILLWLLPTKESMVLVALSLFFAGFTLLESFLPSLISRTAPVSRKGSALGIYSCAQFFGIFVGGVLGGWLYGRLSYPGVYSFCILLSLIWLIFALFMQPPRFLVTQLLRLSPAFQPSWELLATKFEVIPGMIEVTFIAEENMVYLKMERSTRKHPDFIRLKEQLQSK